MGTAKIQGAIVFKMTCMPGIIYSIKPCLCAGFYATISIKYGFVAGSRISKPSVLQAPVFLFFYRLIQSPSSAPRRSAYR